MMIAVVAELGNRGCFLLCLYIKLMFMVSVFGSWVLAFDGGFWGCLLLEYTWVYLGFSAFDVCL